MDSDFEFEFERVAVGEERNAHARVEEQGIPTAAAPHCEEEEELHVRLESGLLAGTKRKAAGEHDEPRTTKAVIQDEKEYTAEDSYGQSGAGLLQGRNMEATVTASKLQLATGPEIHDEQCLGYKKDHQVLAEEENVGMVTSKIDSKMMAAAQAPVEEPSSGAADRHCDGEYIAENSYAQIGDGLLQRRNMEGTVTASKLQPTTGPQIHDKKCSGYKKAHQVAAEEENVGVAVSVSDGQMTAAAQAPVEDPSSGAAADRHCDEEVSRDCYVQLHGGLLGMKRKASVTHAQPHTTGTEIQDEQGHEKYVSWDCYVQLQGGLLGRKRKAVATHAEPQTTEREIQDERGEHISYDNDAPTGVGLQGRKREATVTPGKVQTTNRSALGECLRPENEMLRQQLMRKTKELEAEAEKIRILKLELDVKDKEIKSLEKQNKELRCEREHYRKIAKPSRNPSLFCNEHALSQGCPERHGSASSEQDEGSDSY